MEFASPESEMYRWRRWTAEQRQEALDFRKKLHRPLHSVPHWVAESGLYMITCTCYEHASYIAGKPGRMAEFEAELLAELKAFCQATFAWVILPNHYHVLVECRDIRSQLVMLGRLHGRTSFHWNGEDSTRKRKVWHGAVETAMKSDRDWPYSNAAEYLEKVGREEAITYWRAYPLLDYGVEWDPPEM